MAEGDQIFQLQAQIEEIEALQSIYGGLWRTFENSNGSYGMDIVENGVTVTLEVTLPENYPHEAPPSYQISAPALTSTQKNCIYNLLDQEYLNNIGQCVLYQWVEKIREYLLSEPSQSIEKTISRNFEEIQDSPASSLEPETVVPEVTSGQVITDRKSSFQGHAASVHSVDQVKLVLNTLKKNKKIANATHNIYAYRISLGNKSFIQDCDDDGETQAGGRLLHLLQITNVSDVLVVVSRWYGGIQLGADRFRHINNAARNVLVSANFIST